MNTKRILYKNDKKDEYHVYTPDELEQLNEIALLRQRAVNLYELALDLLERVESTSLKGNLDDSNHWNTESLECELRVRTIEKESLEKQLELLRSIGRIERWELPERGKVGNRC